MNVELTSKTGSNMKNIVLNPPYIKLYKIKILYNLGQWPRQGSALARPWPVLPQTTSRPAVQNWRFVSLLRAGARRGALSGVEALKVARPSLEEATRSNRFYSISVSATS